MDLLLPAFQLFYFVIHFLYSLAQAVFDCFLELYHILLNFLWWKKHPHFRGRQVLQDASKLKKLPRHLGVIFMAKQTNNLRRVCYLINWVVGFGIPNISLYDVDGMLKLKLPSLLHAMTQTCVDVTIQVVVDGQVYVQDCGGSSSSKLCDKSKNQFCLKNSRNCVTNLLAEKVTSTKLSNGINSVTGSQQHILTLNILCIEDGKEDIVRLCKKSCRENCSPLHPEYITSELITSGQIDPDLVVVVGRPICSLGFLPWQIRLTEFLNIPSLSRLNYFEFRRLLNLYSNCEQRFGR